MEDYRWDVKSAALATICLVVISLWSPFSKAQPSLETTDSGPAELLAQGQFQAAGERALRFDDAASLRVRSLLAMWQGDDDAARRFARAALEARSDEREARRGVIHQARLDWLYGRREEALNALRELLREVPQDLEARYELGAMLIDEGAQEEGRGILLASAQRFNDGLITEVDELVWLGRAMMAGDRPRDANRAFSQALRIDEEHVEANLRFGELMWSRYNTPEALEGLEKVLAASPNHPEALALMAEIRFYRSGRFAESMELLDEAVASFPGHPKVLRTRADLLIVKGEWEVGLQQAQALLRRFPDDGESLALVASAAVLLSMDEELQEARAHFDRRRANHPMLDTRIGETLAKNRRNEVAIQYFRAALERRTDYPAALSGLGFALARSGQESEGIGYLERAFDLDSFDVRVYNTLELYDRGLKDYLTHETGRFRLRAHVSQFDLIESVSVPLMALAMDSLNERYGLELDELMLEVYSDPESFSVRTVGLPHIDPHGICFGPVVLTRSPGEGNFNWSLVTWHELAHSYHLVLSDYGVPRWFTEGLAEYETFLRDAAWTRFHDVDLAQMLQHNRLWSISAIDEVFMTGRGIEVSYAYQVAMLVMAYLDETYGFDAIVEMLRAFRHEGRTEVVFRDVLEKDIAAVDREFRTWLERRFGPLMQHASLDQFRLREMVTGDDVEHASRAEASAYRALKAQGEGNTDEARIHIENALRRGGEEAEVLLAATILYDGLDDVEKGLEAGRTFLDLGYESFELRYTLARLATRSEDHLAAYVHALAAAMSYPDNPEGWRLLASKASQVGEDRLARRARWELFQRDPHSPQLARQMAQEFQESGDGERWAVAARRWTEIAALDAEAHRMLAEAQLARGNAAEARQAYQHAALASVGRRQELLDEGVLRLREAGEIEEAALLEATSITR